MEKPNHTHIGHVIGSCALALALAACNRAESHVQANTQALSAQCATAAAPAPSGAWICPDTKTVECTGGNGSVDVDLIYVQDDPQQSCENQGLAVSDPGPFTPGTHTIDITSDEDAGTLCTAQLEVTDSQPPVIVEHTLNLWPPNHKRHPISVSDCVSAEDACDGTLQGEFVWASSDEPIDSIGDGHTDADIGFVDAHNACVRSERQGPKDGRVYKLGVRVVDAAGNASEGACTIIVDHDQRGALGEDSGDAYRVTYSAAPQVDPCGGGGGGGPLDGGAADGGAVDGGALDGGAADGSVADGGAADGGVDAGAPDVTPLPMDGGTPF